LDFHTRRNILRWFIELDIDAWAITLGFSFALSVRSFFMIIMAELAIISIGASIPREKAAALAITCSMQLRTSGWMFLRSRECLLDICLVTEHSLRNTFQRHNATLFARCLVSFHMTSSGAWSPFGPRRWRVTDR
jgi:hypothetical protein